MSVLVISRQVHLSLFQIKAFASKVSTLFAQLGIAKPQTTYYRDNNNCLVCVIDKVDTRQLEVMVMLIQYGVLAYTLLLKKQYKHRFISTEIPIGSSKATRRATPKPVYESQLSNRQRCRLLDDTLPDKWRLIFYKVFDVCGEFKPLSQDNYKDK